MKHIHAHLWPIYFFTINSHGGDFNLTTGTFFFQYSTSCSWVLSHYCPCWVWQQRCKQYLQVQARICICIQILASSKLWFKWSTVFGDILRIQPIKILSPIAAMLHVRDKNELINLLKDNPEIFNIWLNWAMMFILKKKWLKTSIVFRIIHSYSSKVMVQIHWGRFIYISYI